MSRFVSVLMPVLNEEKSLARAVTSVLQQEGCELEVIIVDGCSADRTAEIAAEIAHQDHRVRVLRNPDVTIPAGLNRGLRAARGEFVARVDGHAHISPGYFAVALDWLQSQSDLAAVGGRRSGWAASTVGRAIALVLSSPYGVGNSINHYGTARQLTDHASFGVYRAHAARQVGGWDESLLVNEDVDFDHQLIKAGYTIGYDPALVINWHVRETIPDLFRQSRRYGRGKGLMVRKNGRRAIRLRHLVPPIVVVGSAGLLLVTLWQPLTMLAFLPYAALVSLGTARAWREAPTKPGIAWVAVPLAFAATHYGWGLGFLEGRVLGRQPARASGSAASTAATESATPQSPDVHLSEPTNVGTV